MNTLRITKVLILVFFIPAYAVCNAQVFSTQSSEYRVGDSLVAVDTDSRVRVHDFGPNGGFVDPRTGVARVATIISGISYGKSVVLSGVSITNKGIPGRVYWQPNGVVTQINAGEGRSGEPCRAQVSSFPVLPDVKLRWHMQFRVGDSSQGQEWTMTPYGNDPTLIWQLKAPGLRPSLAMILDTDDTDSRKLMIYFSQLSGAATKVQRAGSIRGLVSDVPINVVIEARLDERTLESGGSGYWRAWVNDEVVVDRIGPTLSLNAAEPHQWFFGMYRYLTNCPTSVSRRITWDEVKLERAELVQ